MSHYQAKLKAFIEDIQPANDEERQKAQRLFDGTLGAHQARLLDAMDAGRANYENDFHAASALPADVLESLRETVH